MGPEGMQHFQPTGGQDPDSRAEEILSRITQNKNARLTPEEEEELRKSSYGDLVEDIKKHRDDPSVPPWMH